MSPITHLFLFFFLTAASAFPTPLICPTPESAVRVVAAACQLNADCRFEYGAGDAALIPAGWRILLEQQTGLLANTSALAATNDIRRMSYPTSLMAAAPPLLAYTSALDPSAQDCDALALAITSDPTLVPDSVWFALATLIVHQTHTDEERACADLNEIPVLDNSTDPATVQYLCAPSKSCNMGSTWVYDFLVAIGIFLLTLAIGGIIFFIVFSVLALKRFMKHHRWLKKHQQLNEISL